MSPKQLLSRKVTKALRLTALVLLPVILSMPGKAYSHKLRIYAWINGGKVFVECGLSGNRHLVSGNVTIKNSSSGEIIKQGVCNSEGLFSFSLTPVFQENPFDMTITVSTDDGHRADWVLTREDFQDAWQPDDIVGNGDSVNSGNAFPDRNVSSISSNEIRAIIDERLEKKLAPIHRQLAHMKEEKVSLRDIIGGIGYLLGLAGFVAWLKSRGQKASVNDFGQPGSQTKI